MRFPGVNDDHGLVGERVILPFYPKDAICPGCLYQHMAMRMGMGQDRSVDIEQRGSSVLSLYDTFSVRHPASLMQAIGVWGAFSTGGVYPKV